MKRSTSWCWRCLNCDQMVEQERQPLEMCPHCNVGTYAEHQAFMKKWSNNNSTVPIGMGNGINDVGPGSDGGMG